MGHIRSLVKNTSAVLNQQAVENYADHLILQHHIEPSCSEKRGDRAQQKPLSFTSAAFFCSEIMETDFLGDHRY